MITQQSVEDGKGLREIGMIKMAAEDPVITITAAF